MGLIKKLRKAKKEAPPNEKPAVVKTHLRDMIVVPEMIGSVVGIYNGKVCSFPSEEFAGRDIAGLGLGWLWTFWYGLLTKSFQSRSSTPLRSSLR